jgi:hypothetical protein
MGREYRLQFAHANPERVEAVLRTVALFVGPGTSVSSFDFRAPANTGAMPDATAALEPDGLYFCDHGGQGRHVLQDLIGRITEAFGTPAVVEVE